MRKGRRSLCEMEIGGEGVGKGKLERRENGEEEKEKGRNRVGRRKE